jgi:hypothetical protein
MLNDLFDCVYYINLDCRQDRKEEFWTMNKNFLNEQKTKRISAVDAKNTVSVHNFFSLISARAGISSSYILPFIDAQKNGYNKILIFEDDAQPLFSNLDDITKSILSAEENNYSILFLGGSIQSKLQKQNDYLYKLNNNILATQAVAYNNLSQNIFNEFLKFKNFSFEQMRDYLMNHGGCCMDTIIGQHLTGKYNSFISNPLFYGQKEGYSNINSQKESYTQEMLQRFKDFAK